MSNGNNVNTVDIKQKILNMLNKIENEQLLNRIYRFIKYLYIHKT